MRGNHSHRSFTDRLTVDRSHLLILGLAIVALAFAGATRVAAGSPAATRQPSAILAPSAGGPDDFGYTWATTLDPGGPPYVWDEIAGVGTLVDGGALVSVGYSGPLAIGFPFSFYGADYTGVYASRNGYISFGQGYNSYYLDTIPSPYEPNNQIAMFGADLTLSDYGTNSQVYYVTLASPQRFVVEYVNVYPCCSTTNPLTFQVVLFPNGDSEVRYKQLRGQVTQFVGIENATGTDGLLYTGGLANNLAVRYSYPVGVILKPTTAENIGAPGSTATYSLSVTNRTGATDNFNITIDPGNAWQATPSIAQTGPLAANASLSFDVTVDVPANATVGDTDQAVVRVSSALSPTVFDTSVLTTTASNGQIAVVTLSDSDLVALVDSELHSVLGTIDVGAAGCDFPWRVAKTPDGNEAYVSCENSDSVVAINLTSRTVMQQVAGIYRADGVAFSRDGTYAFIGSRSGGSNAINRINTQTYAVSSIYYGSATRSIAVHPYLDLAYITDSAGAILVLDTSVFGIVDTIPVSAEPWDVAVSPDGRWVFTGDRSSGVITVIDTTTNAIHTTIGGLGTVTGLSVSPDGSILYAAGLSSGVRAIDTTTYQILGTVAGIGNAWEVATTCQDDEVWVGNTSGSVPVIDAASMTLTAPIPMPGGGTKEIVICPQYVAHGVILNPPTQTGSAALGASTTHQVTVVNATGQSDTFQLSLGASQWSSQLSATTVGPLADGQAATVTVTVDVPSGAQWYATDTVQLTAVAVSQAGISNVANLTTEAFAPPVAGVQPAALSVTQLVNQTADQPLTISNGNGVTLTVEISDVDNTAAGSRPELMASASYTTTVDNEDNYLTGNPDGDMDTDICDYYWNYPIEFNIFVDTVAAPLGNTLAIRAYGVDLPGEAVGVSLNGSLLGQLADSANHWSITTFDLPAGVVTTGANLVQVSSVGGSTCVDVDWGALTVAGPPADWLHENPSSLLVPPNESREVTVTFDATGLQPGQYQGTVMVASNDPAHSPIPIAASMIVDPTADMGRVTGTVIDAWTGQPLAATVELVGIYTTQPEPDYEIWAPAGNYSLVASAPGYVSVTTPVAITAGQITVQDVALELNQPRLQWSPPAVAAAAAPGGSTTATLSVINAGPAVMNAAFFEINLLDSLAAPSPQDLTGKRILYDRAHDEPPLTYYSTLANDAVNAGATINENWFYPVDESVLEGYDILWVNCCGYQSWGYDELAAIDQWLRRGGALLVQGGKSPTTDGPASIFGIYYVPATCASGATSYITPHPISAGVSTVQVYYTCDRLSPSAGSSIVVLDNVGQPHVVTKETNGGKIVVVGSDDLQNGTISYADNRLLGNNILGWLARPSYSDVPWLTVSPTAMTIPGHSSQDLLLTFDAANLPAGDYHATLAIEHNDPAHEVPAEVPITFSVHPPTAVALASISADVAAAPLPLSPLPLAAAPVAALAALALASYQRRRN